MEDFTELRNLLAAEENLAESRLRSLTRVLDHGSHGLPGHILEALENLKSNAEEDLSNILHIQSTLPNVTRSSITKPKTSPAKTMKSFLSGDTGAVLGQVDEGVETALAVTDDLFLMDGTELENTRSPQSLPYSDEEIEDSEVDEGIHMVQQRRTDRQPVTEIAASLPVGIPWPAQLASRTILSSRPPQEGESHPRDIAASIQAIAKSVHTSSMFGDNVFGELPRPRTKYQGSKNN